MSAPSIESCCQTAALVLAGSTRYGGGEGTALQAAIGLGKGVTLVVVATHVTLEELETSVREFVDGWNAHDPDRILAENTPDVVWKLPLSGTIVGHGRVRKELQSQFLAFPDFHLHDLVVYVAPDGESAVATWRLTATMKGRLDPPGFAATGRPIEIEGACLYGFRDGMIARHTVVFDGVDYARQLGALPKGDLMAVLMQRTRTWWSRRRER